MRVCVFNSLTAFIIFLIGNHSIVIAAHKQNFGLTNFLLTEILGNDLVTCKEILYEIVTAGHKRKFINGNLY